MLTPTTKTILHLSLIPKIGPASVLTLIKNINQANLETIYNYNTKDFITKCNVSERIAQILVSGLADRKIVTQELSLIKKYNITLHSITDVTYPTMLKEIYHPPLVLYCKGAPLENRSKRLAIVGSRNGDEYAQKNISLIVPKLIDKGWEIVSGGAIGIDSMAHQATLDAQGKTIAVFGSGLMEPYPKRNKELFRSIIKNDGTILSSFPLQMQPQKGNFPARNRIIAGLSHGCLIVQAAQKSGALITAQFALNEGRQVFALPGMVNNALSQGCHTLIQEGAKLVETSDDILEEFSYLC